MNDIKDSILNNNLDLLSRGNEQLALELRIADIPSHVKIFPAENRLPTAEVKFSSDCPRLLHSAIDPLEEANSWAQRQNITTEHFALFGLGLGYQALALINQGFPGRIYIVERDIGIFKLAAIHCDLTPILSANNIHLFIGKDADNFLVFLKQSEITILSYRTYEPVASLHSQFYQDVSVELDKIIFENHRINDPQLFSGVEILMQSLKE
jgi:hypothetical protein